LSTEAAEIAKRLVEIGQRLALAGESPYKARAYMRAAESLLTLTIPLSEVIAQGRLQEIPGVGAAIAANIQELHRSGTTGKLDRLRADTPESVLEMLRIPGLGPEKVAQIHKRLGIATLADLEEACRSDRIKNAKGLGPSVQTRVLQGLDHAPLARAAAYSPCR
jgi:DNA polymerase (family X)